MKARTDVLKTRKFKKEEETTVWAYLGFGVAVFLLTCKLFSVYLRTH